MYTDDIRRHPDGSIDFDYYRRRAVRLRARVMRGFVKRTVARHAVLVAAMAMVAILASIGTQGGKPRDNHLAGEKPFGLRSNGPG